MKIDRSVEPYKYYDVYGVEIHAGDYVLMNGRKEKVYLCDDECSLGTDATNPTWIESGKACPTEFGIYHFVQDDNPVLVEEKGE